MTKRVVLHELAIGTIIGLLAIWYVHYWRDIWFAEGQANAGLYVEAKMDSLWVSYLSRPYAHAVTRPDGRQVFFIVCQDTLP